MWKIEGGKIGKRQGESSAFSYFASLRLKRRRGEAEESLGAIYKHLKRLDFSAEIPRLRSE